MHLKKKSQEAKVKVARKSQEEDQVKVKYNIGIRAIWGTNHTHQRIIQLT